MKALVAALSILGASTVMAEPIIVQIDVADQYNKPTNGGFQHFSQANGRVGADTGKLFMDMVLPFALPVIPDGEAISSATLTINVEGWLSFASIGDGQLFGINRVSSVATPVLASDVVDAGNVGATPLAVLLQSSFIPNSLKSGTSGSNQTIPLTSTDISTYILGLYDLPGATPGQFGFLTLGVDMASVGSTANNYYTVSSANSATVAWRPYITIETVAVPEPATYGLILGGMFLMGTVWVRRRAK